MDRVLVKKLLTQDSTDGREARHYLVKVAKEYVQLGRKSVDYYATDFDVAHDLFNCYAQLAREDLEKLEAGHPRRYVLPMTMSQIGTMATFIAQALFGTDTPHKVEPRGPEDEYRAESVNQLLRWNAERQSTYLIGYMWVVDCLLYNRGIMYESYQPILKSRIDPIEVNDPDAKKADGTPLTYTKWVRKNETIGGYNKLHLVSPYDFICDPGLPFYRIQEMRFCGHRSRIPWIELKRRSQLEPDNPQYVLADSVEKLKTYKKGAGVGVSSGAISSGSNASTMASRSAYDRTRPSTPLGNDTANKEDGGYVEVYELWIKLIPKDNKIGEDKDVRTWQILLGNESELLSANESILAHDEFPYAVGEGRPSPHYQFTPSWALELKPIQDYVDYLKNRHQEAQSNTIGNIFLIKPDKVDVSDFEDPKKEGKFISIRPEAGDVDLNTVIKQVPINDVTKDFTTDMQRFMGFAEMTSGSTSQMQGQADDASATAVAGASQMAMGRLSSVARVLSSEALVPQTRRIVSNFQQFMDEKVFVKLRGSSFDLPPELLSNKGIWIGRDTIQGEFDYIPHDGTLPTTDAKKVAGITRLIESAGAFPFLFDPNVPGNFDLKKLFAAGAKAIGVPIENYVIRTPSGQGGMPGQPPPPPPEQGDNTSVPNMAPAPQTPSSAPRNTDLGDGMTAPTMGLQPLVPAIRPANA